MAEDGPAINMKIGAELHARAKALAEWKGQSLRTWVIRAVIEVVERQEAERAEEERKRRSR